MTSAIAKILIADDNPQYLSEALTAFGYETVTVYNALQLLQMLNNQDNDIDLVLLDITIPDFKPFETLKLIRNKEHLELLPIIILSAENSEQKQIAGLKSGADDYIAKPYSFPNLLARIETLLRRVKLTEQKFSNSPKSMNIPLNTNKPILQLTQREKEILTCVAHGDNNATISEKLFVREVTVKTHLNKIFKKLNATNRTQAVLTAIQMDILQ